MKRINWIYVWYEFYLYSCVHPGAAGSPRHNDSCTLLTHWCSCVHSGRCSQHIHQCLWTMKTLKGECCVPKCCWNKWVMAQVPLPVSTSAWPANAEITHPLPTKTRMSISVESLVALAEVRADDVATASVGVTTVTTWCALILIWKEKMRTYYFKIGSKKINTVQSIQHYSGPLDYLYYAEGNK